MVLRIGACRIDIDRRQIIRDGCERHLSRKAFELLLILLHARPKVVTKDELIARVWPDAFVSDANLAVLVGDVRAAIGDTARNARLIKTHHGLGYSFIGQVSEIAPARSSTVSGFMLIVGTRRILLPDGVVTVGRDDTCDVVLPHRSVSRVHARLIVSGQSLVVEDAGSKNGTRLDGIPLHGPSPACEGQRVQFGSIEALIGVDQPSTASTITGSTPD